MSMHISQPEVAPLVLKSKSFMVDSQHMQNGGMKIMHMYSVFFHAVRIIIRTAVSDARFDSTSGKPGGKIPRMMICQNCFR